MDKDNCKTRWETLKFWDLVWLTVSIMQPWWAKWISIQCEHFSIDLPLFEADVYLPTAPPCLIYDRGSRGHQLFGFLMMMQICPHQTVLVSACLTPMMWLCQSRQMRRLSSYWKTEERKKKKILKRKSMTYFLVTIVGTTTSWGPFYWHGLTLIPAWISNYIHYKVWDEIIYPFLNFPKFRNG